jgi:Lipid A 3-O-deacylase (PagL)
MRLAYLFSWLLLLSTPLLSNGICRTDPIANDYHHEFQFYAGYSPNSPTLIGTAENRRFAAAGFNYFYRCWAWNRFSITFTPGVMPAAILLQPNESFLVPTSTNTLRYETVTSQPVYGFAITPVGFSLDIGRTRSVYPFLQTDEGIIASTQPIPENIPDATGLNFLVDIGGGIKFQPSSKRFLLVLGYKFLHISNADTTRANPGVDNNIFYVGYSFLR